MPMDTYILVEFCVLFGSLYYVLAACNIGFFYNAVDNSTPFAFPFYFLWFTCLMYLLYML